MEMELLNHLKHPHPLILSEEKFHPDICCIICQDRVVGLCYCCNDCVFVIHKWCAELPLELTNHQLHPDDHPRLVLLSAEERAGRELDACCRDCKQEIGVSYVFSCQECSIVLHPECALLLKKVVLEFNDADSRPARRDLFFTKKVPGAWGDCCVCKDGLKDSRFIIKDNISYSYHIHCVMLPKTVKHDRHFHELTLHVDIEKEKNYHGCYCDLCEEERDPDQWLYYCATCEVVCHLSCGLLGQVPPSKGILTSNRIYTDAGDEPKVDAEREKYMAALITRVQTAREEREPLGELVHFSHKHPLFLYNDVWNGIYTCQACEICIYGEVYVCEGCRFHLHKWCAELPREAHFGFHLEHPLTLSKYSSLCSHCQRDKDAFSYSCLECDFGVHTICAFLSEYEKHRSHHHPLQVMLLWEHHFLDFIGKIPIHKKNPPCKACQFPCEGMSLGCEECKFYLHVGCSLYPPTGKARTHRHSLKLNYNYQEDPRYDEFFCDACEKPRTPSCWVYCCPDGKCNEFLSHLDCAVPDLFRTLSSEQNIEHENDSIACCCDACEKERDPNDWIYYRPSPKIYLLNGLEVPELDRPFQRILKSDPVYAFLTGKVPDDKPKVEELLKHFSHEHPLVLCNEKWNDAIKCEACNRGIYGHTYVCHECGYYLHKWCAQIPQQMHFKFHPEHPLTILPGHDFECRVCEIKSFGFSFSCKKCDFEAHTLCSLMPEKNTEKNEELVDIVFYTRHDPNLITSSKFSVDNGPNPICEGCKFPCEGLTIKKRTKVRDAVYLHVGCSWYPRIIKTEAHTHTLTLDSRSADLPDMVIPISHRSFCEVCDKELTPDFWGYICTDEKCNVMAAHLDCAVPNLFLTSSFESILVD